MDYYVIEISKDNDKELLDFIDKNYAIKSYFRITKEQADKLRSKE